MEVALLPSKPTTHHAHCSSPYAVIWVTPRPFRDALSGLRLTISANVYAGAEAIRRYLRVVRSREQIIGGSSSTFTAPDPGHDVRPMQRSVSSPSTCRSYCEVRWAADGAGSTPSRNAEFRGSLEENGGHHAVLRATQSPAVRGTAQAGGMRAGVLVRRSGCYGETVHHPTRPMPAWSRSRS